MAVCCIFANEPTLGDALLKSHAELLLVGAAPGTCATYEVIAVGAWKHAVFATLQGSTAALVVPCVTEKKPAVVPVASKIGASTPPVPV